MTFIEAAVAVLEKEGRPMQSREIAEKAVDLGILSHVGKTPVQTMSARLSAAVAKGNNKGPFVRTGRGVFGLAKWQGKPPGPSSPSTPAPARPAPPKPDRQAPPAPPPPTASPERTEERAPSPSHKEPPPASPERTEGRSTPPSHKEASTTRSEFSSDPSAAEKGPSAKKRRRKKRKSPQVASDVEATGSSPAPQNDTSSPPPSAYPTNAQRPVPSMKPEILTTRGSSSDDLMDRVEALLRQQSKAMSTADILAGVGLSYPAAEMLLESLLAADGLERESRGRRSRFIKHKSGYRLLEREISAEIVSLERQADEARLRLVQIAERQVARRLRGLSMGAFAKMMISYLHRSGFGAMVPVDLTNPGEFHLSVQDRRHQGRFRTAVVLRRDPAEHVLSERSVMDLRGAIHHYDAMGGMILTTGRVSERATLEGRIANLTPVALIDGETLARELVRLGIGIKSRSLSLPAFDDTVFSALE